MINLPFCFFLFIYLIYSPRNSLNLSPPTRSWSFLSLSYFSSWSPVFVFLPPFFFLKEVSLMFSRCFSLSLLSLPFFLVPSCPFYQQLSCLCKGQSLPICLTRLSDTQAHTCTRTHTHTQTFCGLTAPPVLPVLLSVLVQLHCANTAASSSVTCSTFTRGNCTSQVTHTHTETHACVCVLTPKMSARY